MLLSIVLLFAVVTAISLMIPARIRISKAANIGASPSTLRPLLVNEDGWRQWHPAFMNDSFRLRHPLQLRLQSVSDSEVLATVAGPRGRPVLNGFRLYTHPGSDSLTLQWYMDFHLRWYPWEKFGSLFYENTYGVLMQEGVEKLKQAAEGR